MAVSLCEQQESPGKEILSESEWSPRKMKIWKSQVILLTQSKGKSFNNEWLKPNIKCEREEAAGWFPYDSKDLIHHWQQR